MILIKAPIVPHAYLIQPLKLVARLESLKFATNCVKD